MHLSVWSVASYISASLLKPASVGNPVVVASISKLANPAPLQQRQRGHIVSYQVRLIFRKKLTCRFVSFDWIFRGGWMKMQRTLSWELQIPIQLTSRKRPFSGPATVKSWRLTPQWPRMLCRWKLKQSCFLFVCFVFIVSCSRYTVRQIDKTIHTRVPRDKQNTVKKIYLKLYNVLFILWFLIWIVVFVGFLLVNLHFWM